MLACASLAALWRDYRKHLLLFAGILAPAVSFNLATIGRLLPNTYYAKVGDFGLLGALYGKNYIQVLKTLGYYRLQQLKEVIQLAVSENLVLACFAPIGLLHMVSLCWGGGKSKPVGRSALFLLILLGYPLIRGLLAPFQGPLFQHGRYVGFLFPLFLEREQPDYLVVMPTWYPELVRREDLFQSIYEIVLSARSIAAGDRLVVYRTKWAGG